METIPITVEEVDNSDIIEEDTNVSEASADIEKEIKDYLNPKLYNLNKK